MHSYSANYIFVLPVHCYGIKLLTNRAEYSWVCMDSQESPLFHWIIQAKNHHLDGLLGNHRHCQTVFNCFYNVYYVYKFIISVCFAVPIPIQFWYLIQAKQKQHNTQHIILASIHKYWKAAANAQWV